MDFFFHQLLLFLSIGGLLFLPGFVALRCLFGKHMPLIPWETLLTSCALSIGLLDFLMIFLGKRHISFSAPSITIGLIVLLGIFFLIRKFLNRNGSISKDIKSASLPFTFTKTGSILFLLIMTLTLVTKVIYLSDAAFPTSTDLGHHLYWSKVIAKTGALPQYSKTEIVTDGNGGEMISEPEPIADFIIGEHLPFAALALFSRNDFISAFPVNVLFLINILSLLAYFVLALRLGEDIQKKFTSFLPEHFALITLFLLGPLYTLTSPQAKFVSGGVVGNTLGNFLIPIILLFFLRSVREKNPLFMGLSFFLTFTIAYTHHLSTLVLLFILFASIGSISLLHIHSLRKLLTEWVTLLRHPFPLIIALSCILFFFVVAMPTYIETHAIGTAIGTPTKTTRIGLTFDQLVSGSGEARATLGLTGLIIILFFARSFKNTAGILIGGGVVLLIMSLWPSLVFLDIPSDRIGSYALFPLTLLAGFTILLIPEFAKKFSPRGSITLPSSLIAGFLFILFAYSITSGSADNAGALLATPKATEAVQTFAVSQFLSERIGENDLVLKDHNYLSADSFMKIFFMRDYGFPLSRGYFKRYETPGHEQCSLTMIAAPNTTTGEQCFVETGTDIVIINPLFDRAQFEKSRNFSRIYSSPLIEAYRRTSL